MTDYNVTVISGTDYGQGEDAEGTITLDGAEFVWVYDVSFCDNNSSTGNNRRRYGYNVYQPLPRDAKMRTRQKMNDGRKLRRIPVSKRSDYAAIVAAIRKAVNRYFEPEREADNGTTTHLGMEGSG
jgi:hypothetical protein